MTGLLQPLDVAVNKSFQDFFGDKYTEYLSTALLSETGKTKAGNIKVPNYKQVTDWIYSWSLTKSDADIRKAFSLCGLVSENLFKIEDLHPELRACFNKNVESNTNFQDYEYLE